MIKKIKRERRKEKRIDVAIKVTDKENGKPLGIIKNLTGVGCFIVTKMKVQLPKIESVTTIGFNLPKAREEIITNAKVMWHKKEPRGMGVLFFSMSNEHFLLLQEFVEKTEK